MDDLHGRQVDTDEPAGTLFRESTRPQGKHGKFPLGSMRKLFRASLIARNIVGHRPARQLDRFCPALDALFVEAEYEENILREYVMGAGYH
jgi:hypothetical protein